MTSENQLLICGLRKPTAYSNRKKLIFAKKMSFSWSQSDIETVENDLHVFCYVPYFSIESTSLILLSTRKNYKFLSHCYEKSLRKRLTDLLNRNRSSLNSKIENKTRIIVVKFTILKSTSCL
jgi:hypothetical protein